MEPIITQNQQTALLILQTNNNIATPEQLAAVISSPDFPKYHKLPERERVKWLGQQINALNYMTHSNRISNEEDLLIESLLLDQTIMNDEGMRNLTNVEIQEAFRKGVIKEYGEYYGITPVSLVSFIKGYMKSSKRQRALSILFEKAKRRVEEEKKRESRMLYESKVKNLKLPFWRSAREPHGISSEESIAHRKKIEEQRVRILSDYDNKK